MADIVDRAQQREEEILKDAQARRRLELDQANRMESPIHDVDGNRICIDCEEKIPDARLKAMPHAVRCCSCQVIKEHTGRGS